MYYTMFKLYYEAKTYGVIKKANSPKSIN